MNPQNKHILIPQYVQKFKCIGTACEDSCCVGWKVVIDEDTYKKYRKCPDAELLGPMTRNVTRNRSNPNASNYAKIKMLPDSNCPFLDAEHLCTIQKKLGEEYLSLTCTTYPRITNIVNEVLEKSMTMSCPEAARLALLNPNVMEFDEVEKTAFERNVPNKTIETHSFSLANKAVRYFWELRIFTIQILQNREYTLSERLILLGLCYQKIETLIEAENILDIPMLLASYLDHVEKGLYKEYFAGIPSNNQIQMLLLKELMDERIFSGSVNHRYMECFTEFLLGIGHLQGALKEEITLRYTEACEKYYEPFMRDHEYILENYLVNFVFKNLFPLSGEKKLFESYMMLVIHYALIKTHLIGIAGLKKENFNREHIIKLIQAFAKTVEHNNVYLKAVYNLLLENGYTNMAYMAILIKN